MSKTENQNEGLKVEELSVDKKALNLQSISKQIHEIAKEEKVMRENANACSFLDELEGKTIESKRAPESDREDRE